MSDVVRRLQDRIDDLEGLLGLTEETVPARVMGLKPMASAVLGLLLKLPLVSREVAHTALYSNRPEADQPVSRCLIDQFASQIRQAFKRNNLGVTLVSHHGIGWSLSQDDKAKIKAWLKQEDNALEEEPTMPSSEVGINMRPIEDRKQAVMAKVKAHRLNNGGRMEEAVKGFAAELNMKSTLLAAIMGQELWHEFWAVLRDDLEHKNTEMLDRMVEAEKRTARETF